MTARLEDFLLSAAHDPALLLECYQDINKAIQTAANAYGIEMSPLVQDILRRTPKEVLKTMIDAAKQSDLEPSGKVIKATEERTRGIRPDIPPSRR